MTRKLLCVGHLTHDLRPVVRIAERAHTQLQLEPVFLIYTPRRFFDKTKEYIDALGYRTVNLDIAPITRQETRNPLRRFAAIRHNNAEAARNLLLTERPAAILGSVDAARDQLFAEAARANIPSIYLQVAFWGSRRFYRELSAYDRMRAESNLTSVQKIRRHIARRLETLNGIGYRPAWERPATRIAVLGPYWQRLLVQNGMSTKQVVATGNDTTDEIYRLRSGDTGWREALFTKLGLAPGTRYFLHCREHLQRLESLPETVRIDSQLQVLTAMRLADPTTQIVVKLHPREGATEAQLIHDIDPGIIVVQDDVPTLPLIAASCAMVSTLSTTLIWAAALDIPTFSLYALQGVDFFRRETEFSGVKRVYNADELTQAIRVQLSDTHQADAWRSKRAAFAQDQLCLDGHSVERIVNSIDELAAPRSEP